MTNRVRASILTITFAALVALPSIAAAQSLTFGVQAGANLAKLKFDEDNEDVGILVGLNAGAFVQKPINDSWKWRLGAGFSQEGAKDKESGPDAKVKLTYVNVSLPFIWNSSGETKFNLFAGPQLGINTGAKFVTPGQADEDFKDEVKSTAFSALLGAGFERGQFGANVAYALGLTSLAKEGDSVKSNVLSVNAFWTFK